MAGCKTSCSYRACPPSRSLRQTVVRRDAPLRMRLTCCGRAAGFTDNDQASVDVASMKPPDGRIVGLVQILFRTMSGKTYVVPLPSGASFTAITDGARSKKFDIFSLRHAKVAPTGIIQLSKGAPNSGRRTGIFAAKGPF